MNTENQKKLAAEKATEDVRSGMVVGLGDRFHRLLRALETRHDGAGGT